MKNLLFYLFSILSVLLLSCSDGQQPEEPAVPLELDHYWTTAGPWSDNIASFKIKSGNGNYKLIYPKYISLYELPEPGIVPKETSKVPYPEYLDSIVSLHIDESDNVVAEIKIHDQKAGLILFMIKDAKGERAMLEVHHHTGNRPLSGFDYDGAEDPGKDYWVNY